MGLAYQRILQSNANMNGKLSTMAIEKKKRKENSFKNLKWIETKTETENKMLYYP